MSKRKKQVTPLPAIQITPVVVKGDSTGNESLAEFRRRYNREQKAEHDKMLREFERVNTRLATEYLEVLRQFWSRDIPTLAKVMSRKESLEQTGCVDDIGLPTGETDEVAAGKATRAFVATLASRGISLSDDGKTRYMMYVLAQLQGLDVTVTEQSLQTMLDRLISVVAFGDGEVTVDESKQPRKPKPPAPAPRPLTSNDLENETDAQRAKQIAQELMYAEAMPLTQEWLASLSEFGGFQPSHAEVDYVLNTLFPLNNWSHLNYENYHRARRAMVAQGRWPESLFTEDERAGKWIEEGAALSTLDFDERQRLRKQLQLLKPQPTSRKPVVSEEDRAVIAEADEMSADELRTRLQDKDFVARLESAYVRTGRRN